LAEQKFREQNIRMTTDVRSEKIRVKVREARLDLVPYIAVVGAKESESNTVALINRKDDEQGEIEVGKVLEMVIEEIKMRKL
jgi:threonyl-tRNA synthetase